MTTAQELILRAIKAKERFCKLCGTKFLRKGKQIFCSKKCAWTNWNRKKANE